MKTLRIFYHGVPYVLLMIFGLCVGIADDALGWRWLHRFDLWLMAWANKLEERLK